MGEYYYDYAQICHNGHVINSRVRHAREKNKAFCSKCGEMSLGCCPACNTLIQGHHCRDDGIPVGSYKVPAYCHQCGKPYPWTEKSIQAAIDAYSDQVKDEAERKAFAENVREVAQDTPQAVVASGRIKKALGKLGVVGDVIKKIVVDVAATAVKGSL